MKIKNISSKLLGASLIAGMLLTGIAMAAPTPPGKPTTAPGQNKILCFDGHSELTIYGGTCTLNSSGAKGAATLDLTENNPNGDYAGVYTQYSTIYGQALTSL